MGHKQKFLNHLSTLLKHQKLHIIKRDLQQMGVINYSALKKNEAINKMIQILSNNNEHLQYAMKKYRFIGVQSLASQSSEIPQREIHQHLYKRQQQVQINGKQQVEIAQLVMASYCRQFSPAIHSTLSIQQASTCEEYMKIGNQIDQNYYLYKEDEKEMRKQLKSESGQLEESANFLRKKYHLLNDIDSNSSQVHIQSHLWQTDFVFDEQSIKQEGINIKIRDQEIHQTLKSKDVVSFNALIKPYIADARMRKFWFDSDAHHRVQKISDAIKIIRFLKYVEYQKKDQFYQYLTSEKPDQMLHKLTIVKYLNFAKQWKQSQLFYSQLIKQMEVQSVVKLGRDILFKIPDIGKDPISGSQLSIFCLRIIKSVLNHPNIGECDQIQQLVIEGIKKWIFAHKDLKIINVDELKTLLDGLDLMDDILKMENMYHDGSETSIGQQLMESQVYHDIVDEVLQGMASIFRPQIVSTLAYPQIGHQIIIKFEKLIGTEKVGNSQIVKNCMDIVVGQNNRLLPNRVKKSLLGLLFKEDYIQEIEKQWIQWIIKQIEQLELMEVLSVLHIYDKYKCENQEIIHEMLVKNIEGDEIGTEQGIKEYMLGFMDSKIKNEQIRQRIIKFLHPIHHISSHKQ